MRDVSGPFDPFSEKRNSYTDSSDLMLQTCGWIARAWREDDAIQLSGVDRITWSKWVIENEEEVRAAKILGQAMIFAEIRGVALGITTRRGQAASQKLLMELIGAKEPPKRSEAQKMIGELDPKRQQQAMAEFDTGKLEELANFNDNPDGIT
jgi:hypothetical protein